MRWILPLAALLALATTLWLVYAPRPAPSETLAGGPPAGEPEEARGLPGDPAWARLRSGTLHVRVRTPAGTVPLGTQVGYATPRGPRLYYVDADGLRTLADVPLGEVLVLVQAPGHDPVERRTRVEAGVIGEMQFELGGPPAAASGPSGPAGR